MIQYQRKGFRDIADDRGQPELTETPCIPNHPKPPYPRPASAHLPRYLFHQSTPSSRAASPIAQPPTPTDQPRATPPAADRRQPRRLIGTGNEPPEPRRGRRGASSCALWNPTQSIRTATSPHDVSHKTNENGHRSARHGAKVSADGWERQRGRKTEIGLFRDCLLFVHFADFDGIALYSIFTMLRRIFILFAF